MTSGTFFMRLIGLIAVPMFFIAAKHYGPDIKRLNEKQAQEAEASSPW